MMNILLDVKINKIFRTLRNGLLIGLLVLPGSLSVFADEAPVVDVTGSLAPSPDASQSQAATTVPLQDDTSPSTQAPAPSSSTATPATVDPSLSRMSTDQRLARLEQQMANLVQMNLPQQISDLQQTIQQLQGSLQVEQHDLKVLSDQQKTFYQDLDQRISQLKSPSNSGKTVSANLTSSATATTDGKIQDTEAYQAAFALFSQKKYDAAKTAFQNYLKNNPKGQFVMKSHYWLGDILLIQKNYSQAEKQLQIVIQQYPHSDKVADAKLNLAMIHSSQGKTEQARAELQQIKQAEPDSTAAQLANIQLQQMHETSAPTVNDGSAD